MSIHVLERYIHSRKRNMLIFVSLISAMLLIAIHPCHAENRVVLIAAKGSGIERLSNHDIRRIFLGLKSADSEIVNKPVLNLYNEEVYEEFLKNVMHMTEGAYRRKLVKRIFRYGAEEIKEVSLLQELNTHLNNNVGDISFVDYNAVDKMHDVEVVKVLW
jgi:hypothetical protein